MRPLKIETRYFGEITYGEEELIRFPGGLFGFEDEHEYLLLSFEEGGILYSLQSVKTPYLSFTLTHPFSLCSSYAPVLQPEELKSLGVGKSEDLYYYVLCVVRDPVSQSTVNMRCPVAINPDTHVAMQVILEDTSWQMRHPLEEFTGKRGGAPC